MMRRGPDTLVEAVDVPVRSLNSKPVGWRVRFFDGTGWWAQGNHGPVWDAGLSLSLGTLGTSWDIEVKAWICHAVDLSDSACIALSRMDEKRAELWTRELVDI